jgi:hypothetical protein
MRESTTAHEIKALIQSYHPMIAIETVEEDRVDTLLDLIARELRMPVFEWTVTRGLRKRGQKISFHRTEEPLIVLQHLASLTVEGVFVLKDFCVFLEKPDVKRQFRELGQVFSKRRSTLIMTGSDVTLPEEVAHLAVHYDLKLPTEAELRSALQGILESLRAQRPFRFELGPGDLTELIRALSGMTLKQARQAIAYCIFKDGALEAGDIEAILERKGQAIRDSGILEYYPVGTNHYELGGFGNLRRWLERAKVGFSRQARKLNLTAPKGILLVGVQGCGKSLAAKFVAREWKRPLLKLDAARLYDKYIGESEKNFRKAVKQAEGMAPVILWIDEIEKGFASPGGSDSDGGLTRRMLGSFLTWLQEKDAEVFVIATANELKVLPPELLRKGRFDEIFFVDLPDEEERRAIFKIHLEVRKQDPAAIDVKQMVAATEGFSGAEIEQAVVAALYRALHSGSPLTTDILLQEVGETIPLSVSRREDIESLRTWASERFVSVR